MGEVPPFTAVAVKVTLVPAQIGFDDAAMDTDTGSSGLTVMAIAFEIAGFPVGHTALETSWQVRTSLFNGANEYIELVAPGMSFPFFLHWY